MASRSRLRPAQERRRASHGADSAQRQPDGSRSASPPRRSNHSMYTLGINAAFHDSSACLVEDGVVVAASEEERFTASSTASAPSPSRPGNSPTTPSTTASARARSRWPTSTMSPTPMIHPGASAAGSTGRPSPCRCNRAPTRSPKSGKPPGTRSSSPRSSTRPATSPAAPPTTSRRASPARGRTARTGGISSSTTSPTPPAPSSLPPLSAPR